MVGAVCAARQQFEDLSDELKDSADAFGSSIGFGAGSFDQADVQHLASFGALLMRPEASDGILLLGPETAERLRTLRARAEFARRVASRVSELGAAYDLKATRLDLSALQQECLFRPLSSGGALVA